MLVEGKDKYTSHYNKVNNMMGFCLQIEVSSISFKEFFWNLLLSQR